MVQHFKEYLEEYTKQLRILNAQGIWNSACDMPFLVYMVLYSNIHLRYLVMVTILYIYCTPVQTVTSLNTVIIWCAALAIFVGTIACMLCVKCC